MLLKLKIRSKLWQEICIKEGDTVEFSAEGIKQGRL